MQTAKLDKDLSYDIKTTTLSVGRRDNKQKKRNKKSDKENLKGDLKIKVKP